MYHIVYQFLIVMDENYFNLNYSCFKLDSRVNISLRLLKTPALLAYIPSGCFC